jgi:hypothetical protein
MMRVGVLQSVQVGTPHRYGPAGARDVLERPWTTSFFRVPSAEPRWLYTTHLDGNAQADTTNHARPDQAVLLYAAAHDHLVGRSEATIALYCRRSCAVALAWTTAASMNTCLPDRSGKATTNRRYGLWA